MKRRNFLTGAAAAGVAGAAASTFPAPAISQGKMQWIAVSAFGKAGLLGRALERYAAFVTSASGGRLTLKPYHSGELVSGYGQMEAVQSGTAQMGYGAPYYWAGLSDAVSFIAAMPFGLNAQEQNAWIYKGGGQEIADKVYKDLGTKFLAMGNTGNQMGGWYNKEIKTVKDLEGLKFRMPGLGGEILSTFGVNVVNLPGPQVQPALTSGAIDGTEWIGPVADMGFGLYKVCKYYYYPGWHEPATVLDGFFDIKAWEGLDSELKDILSTGAAAVNVELLSQFQALNNAAMAKLIGEHGVQVKNYGEELLTAIGGRAPEVMSARAGKNALAKETYNALVGFRKTMISWNGYSESAFAAARQYADFKEI
ncbi:MAG: TRAP transporter substrate-binding protein DctP [Hyphomicrobiales bacterium]|nr:TRAP transporter substrate-binding protein DctP [Hyphomicrobiales bacterium]